ncbi:MAG: ATP-dependent metallopeptidase FtsH/Yme1/Tma family protein [Deltaproteobacteria bacterium]|nr:ATP-dependent metallopeptidase FtsH/Yme1/Tma family protein [Deltaproteobacteria bacterium]
MKIPFSQFIADLEAGRIASVTFRGKDEIYGHFKPETNEGKRFTAIGSTGPEIFSLLRVHQITPDYERAPETPFWQTFLISWGPVIFLFLVFFFFLRQLQIGGGKAMAFGKSRAHLLTEDRPKVTFADVAGADEAKNELQEVVDFLKSPKQFTRLGGRLPKGVLLMGAPGTGKTLLAKAVAGEAGVPFFSISGSDFVEMFVGVGASRVRDLFDQGKKHAPCIIFIDEIDAVGRHRGAGLGGGHDEREQTLNQLLVEMDGFESAEGVILIAATNRPDVLDPALLRPGRFDRRVVVPRPDVRGREGILRVHSRNKPLGKDVNLCTLAKGTPGFAGADIENLVNEAALLAAKAGRSEVLMVDFESAKDKVLMGAERKSLILSEEERKNTAYHEGGHALVAKLIPGTDPVHKITIIPRGHALGVTQILPSDDRLTMTQEYAENSIAFMMGGRVAEEVIFGHRTSGAGDDFQKATELARRMVCEWGMSAKLGPLAFGKEELVFLGRDMAQMRPYSENTARVIDEEISLILDRNYQRAKELLQKNIKILHNLAEALLEREVLDAEEVEMIVRGESLPAETAQLEKESEASSVKPAPSALDLEPSFVTKSS